MKRPIALLSLSLALASSALADERGFAKALEEWQALYRPLATARGAALNEAIVIVARSAKVRYEAVHESRADGSVPDAWTREEAAFERNLKALDEGYSQGDAREKRALVRLAATLSDRFEEKDAPWYPVCMPPLDLAEGANELLEKWFKESSASYLGLLDDPDARIAEVGVRLLHERYPDAAALRVEAWQRDSRTRFRGIATKWSWLLGENASQALLLRGLGDPSRDIRFLAVTELPREEVEKAYEARRPRFDTMIWAERETLLALGQRMGAKDVLPLAVACLEADDPSVLETAFSVVRFRTEEGADVAVKTLARLRRHPKAEIREAAYGKSGDQRIPMRDLRKGLTDPDPSVRSRAFAACCSGVETTDELRTLLAFGLKSGETFSLTYAAHQLGSKAIEVVLPLLKAADAEHRELGVRMACRIESPRVTRELEKRVVDVDAEVREALAYEVSELHTPDVRRWLKTLASDPVKAVREKAERSLESLERPHEAAPADRGR